MGQQIIFFEKSKIDYTQPNVSATASENPDSAANVLSRGLLSAWVTTGSLDANNTTLTVDMVDERMINKILLVKHNFKSFKVEYWNGLAYVAFSPAIDTTTNTAETNYYSFTDVSTSKLRITIRGTMVADSDKYLYSFIATKILGQLSGWPEIKNPKHVKNKRKNLLLSGKFDISENVGGFVCSLVVKHWKSDADLTLVERIYDAAEGVIMWIAANQESQFSSSRIGYRLEDLYLVKPQNDYEPEFVKGIYSAGLDIKIDLVEVVR